MEDERKDEAAGKTDGASEVSSPVSADNKLVSEARSLSKYHQLDDVSTNSVISKSALDIPASDETTDSATKKNVSKPQSSTSNDRFSITPVDEIELQFLSTPDKAAESNSRSQSPKSVKFAGEEVPAPGPSKPKWFTLGALKLQKTAEPAKKEKSLSPQSQKSLRSSKSTLSPQSQDPLPSSKTPPRSPKKDEINQSLKQGYDEIENADVAEADRSTVPLLADESPVRQSKPTIKDILVDSIPNTPSTQGTPRSEAIRNTDCILNYTIASTVLVIILLVIAGTSILWYYYSSQSGGINTTTSTILPPHTTYSVETTQAPTLPTETTTGEDTEATTFQPSDTTTTTVFD